MRRSSSAAPKRPSYDERMWATLRDWDALFAELGAEVAGRKTRVRANFASAAARFRPRRQQAERELAALRESPLADRRQGTPELERTLAELRDIVAGMPIEGP
jgi:hypothetical protein